MSNLVTITKASALAQVSRTTMYSKIKSGDISTVKDGNSDKIDISELIRIYPNIKLEEKQDNISFTDKYNTLLVEMARLEVENKHLNDKVETFNNLSIERKEREDRLLSLVENLEQKTTPNLTAEKQQNTLLNKVMNIFNKSN